METIKEAAEDQLLPGLSYELPSTASYILDRKQATFHPQSGSTFSSTGNQVMRWVIADAGWLDPSSVRLSWTVKNDDTANVLQPLAPPACCLSRLRILAAGSVAEDIMHYGRSFYMYHTCLPSDRRVDDSVEGFGIAGTSGAQVQLDNIDVQEEIAAGETKKVTVHLLSGLLACSKLIPLRSCPITIEAHLGPATQNMQRGTGKSTTWSVQNAELKCSVVSLDSVMDSQFSAHLLSGRSLYLPFSSYSTTMQTVAGPSYKVDVARGFTALKTLFATMDVSHTATPNEYQQEVNTFVHTANGSNNGSLDTVEFQYQIGGKVYPELPVRSLAEAFKCLREALGISVGTDSVNITPLQFRKNKYIMSTDLEKASIGPGSGGAFTGLNTRNGSLISLNVTGLGAGVAVNKCFVTAHFDAILTIRGEGGVDVAD